MSKKCKAYSVSKLGLEPPNNRKAFYAGWDAALKQEPQDIDQSAECVEPVANVSDHECRRLLYGFMLDCNAVGVEQAGKNLAKGMKHAAHGIRD